MSKLIFCHISICVILIKVTPRAWHKNFINILEELFLTLVPQNWHCIVHEKQGWQMAL